jgi:hypothetical protein
MAYKKIPNVKKNSPAALLTSGIDDSTGTIPIDHLEYFHDKETGALILEGITIWDQADPDPTHREELTITGASGTTGTGNLTGGTRGVNADGTNGAARSFSTGAKIAVMFTTGMINQIRDDLEAAVGSWGNSTITPTWSGGTPDITSTIARHVRNGNVLTFAITINISDGHDAVLDSISLPVATSQIAGHQVPLSSFKLYSDGVDDVMSDPFAYIDFNAATPLIKFRASGGSFPDGCTAVLNISGSYEVPT